MLMHIALAALLAKVQPGLSIPGGMSNSSHLDPTVKARALLVLLGHLHRLLNEHCANLESPCVDVDNVWQPSSELHTEVGQPKLTHPNKGTQASSIEIAHPPNKGRRNNHHPESHQNHATGAASRSMQPGRIEGQGGREAGPSTLPVH